MPARQSRHTHTARVHILGPYYITALITMLGPVVSVIGSASRSRNERTIGSGPRQGQSIPVLVDTHISGVLVHASGVRSTIYMSFDTIATRASRLEVHGDAGSLVAPDPNRFDGDVLLRTADSGDWQVLPVSGGYMRAARGRSVGVPSRGRDGASAALCHGGTAITVQSKCERPPAVPPQAVAQTD
jgi:predicted dehydrogenase